MLRPDLTDDFAEEEDDYTIDQSTEVKRPAKHPGVIKNISGFKRKHRPDTMEEEEDVGIDESDEGDRASMEPDKLTGALDVSEINEAPSQMWDAEETTTGNGDGGMDESENLKSPLEGPDILSKSLKKKCDSYDLRFKTLEDEIGRQGKRIKCLEAEVDDLKNTSTEHQKIRSEFMNAHRRDVRKDESYQHATANVAVNGRAHCGDAVVEASLYFDKKRTDLRIYSELYGISPFQVVILHESHGGRCDQILALNKYATLKARKDISLNDEITIAFIAFVDELELKLDASLTSSDALKLKHDDFWKACDRHS